MTLVELTKVEDVFVVQQILESYPTLGTFLQLVCRLDTKNTLHQKLISDLLTFDSKESYFDWRDEWRASLKDLILEIKRQIKLSREGSSGEIQSLAQATRESLRLKAFNMMLLRKASKKLAREQMVERIRKEKLNEPN